MKHHQLISKKPMAAQTGIELKADFFIDMLNQALNFITQIGRRF